MIQNIEYVFSNATNSVLVICTLRHHGNWQKEFIIDRALLHSDYMWDKIREAFKEADAECAKQWQF